MSKRRCLAVDVFESGEFLSISSRAKVLYVGLVLRSDDEGVVINPTTVMRVTSTGKKEMAELVKSGFVMEIEGMYVICHWHVHNKISPSKVTKSVYQDVLALLRVDSRGVYEYLISDC